MQIRRQIEHGALYCLVDVGQIICIGPGDPKRVPVDQKLLIQALDETLDRRHPRIISRCVVLFEFESLDRVDNRGPAGRQIAWPSNAAATRPIATAP